MFNKLKQYKDLRDQAKQMQNVLGQESAIVEKNGITITMNGNMEVVELTISPELSSDQIANVMRDCINEVVKKVQRIMAEKMQSMGGIPEMG